MVYGRSLYGEKRLEGGSMVHADTGDMALGCHQAHLEIPEEGTSKEFLFFFSEIPETY